VEKFRSGKTTAAAASCPIGTIDMRRYGQVGAEQERDERDESVVADYEDEGA